MNAQPHHRRGVCFDRTTKEIKMVHTLKIQGEPITSISHDSLSLVEAVALRNALTMAIRTANMDRKHGDHRR